MSLLKAIQDEKAALVRSYRARMAALEQMEYLAAQVAEGRDEDLWQVEDKAARKATLLTLLTGGEPVRSRDLRSQYPASHDTFQRDIQELMLEGKVLREGRTNNLTYRLADAPPAEEPLPDPEPDPDTGEIEPPSDEPELAERIFALLMTMPRSGTDLVGLTGGESRDVLACLQPLRRSGQILTRRTAPGRTVLELSPKTARKGRFTHADSDHHDSDQRPEGDSSRAGGAEASP